jgi:predicted RNA-binding Zn-ribbon protein involved in translation (DUF1610 family)
MAKKEKVQIEVEVSSEILNVKHATCSKGHELCCSEKKIHGHQALKVKAKYKDQEGLMHLDPIYGSYDNIEEGMSMPKGGVAEFFCPECGENLTDSNDTCQLCSSPMFIFHLPNGGIVEGCLKKGCLFHKMKIVDAEQQIARSFENNTMESFL